MFQLTNAVIVHSFDASDIFGSYTLEEMKDEFKLLNNELKKRKLTEVKRDKRLHKKYNKAAYALCIGEARLELLNIDENWIEKRNDEMWEKSNMSCMSKVRIFKEKVKSEL